MANKHTAPDANAQLVAKTATEIERIVGSFIGPVTRSYVSIAIEAALVEERKRVLDEVVGLIERGGILSEVVTECECLKEGWA